MASIWAASCPFSTNRRPLAFASSTSWFCKPLWLATASWRISSAATKPFCTFSTTSNTMGCMVARNSKMAAASWGTHHPAALPSLFGAGSLQPAPMHPRVPDGPWPTAQRPPLPTTAPRHLHGSAHGAHRPPPTRTAAAPKTPRWQQIGIAPMPAIHGAPPPPPGGMFLAGGRGVGLGLAPTGQGPLGRGVHGSPPIGLGGGSVAFARNFQAKISSEIFTKFSRNLKFLNFNAKFKRLSGCFFERNFHEIFTKFKIFKFQCEI